MAFIRLSDDYFDNPKFENISDGAFRLWHQALAYCRRHATDGLFSFKTMRGWRFYSKSREQQLSTPYVDGANPLWVLIPKFGYKLHDYLDWNLSKDEEASERVGAADRMRRFRGRRRSDKGERYAVTNAVTNGVTGGVTNAVRSGDGDGNGSGSVPEKGSGEKPPPVDAEAFQEAYRAKWHATYGVPCSLHLTHPQAITLIEQLQKFDPALLQRALEAFFASSDPYVLKSKHAFGLFVREPTKYLVADVAPVTNPDELLAGVRAEIARQDKAVGS